MVSRNSSAVIRSSTIPSGKPGTEDKSFCSNPNSTLYANKLHHSHVKLCSGGIFLFITTSHAALAAKFVLIIAYSRRFAGSFNKF